MISYLTPALGDPVSLEELKAHLRVTHDLENDLLLRLVSAARERIEAELGLRMVEANIREEVSPETAVVALSAWPVTVIDAVSVADGVGGWTALPPTAWLRVGDRPVRVRLRLRPTAVRIDYHAGFGADAAAVPPALRHAVLALAADAYERRADPTDLGPSGLGPAETWAAPYRRARL